MKEATPDLHCFWETYRNTACLTLHLVWQWKSIPKTAVIWVDEFWRRFAQNVFFVCYTWSAETLREAATETPW